MTRRRRSAPTPRATRERQKREQELMQLPVREHRPPPDRRGLSKTFSDRALSDMAAVRRAREGRERPAAEA
jgi:hypothetical protein